MKDLLESAWEAQEPSADFASRTVAAALREPRKPMRRYVVAGALFAAAAAAAIAMIVVRGDKPVLAQGEAVADRRIEVPIGERAVAVLERGARISWRGDRVEQSEGDVFYRVDRGAPFSVQTQAATATVLGTSFRISISNQESVMKRRDVAAGAIGAVAAVVVVVGVYEGKVRVSHAEQAVTVGAGETAVADGTGVRAGGPTVIARAADPGAGSAKTEAQLRQRLAEIEQEKAVLEQELTSANNAVGKSVYDLNAEDWAKLAERGEFKYQYPCFAENGFRPSADQLAKLGLDASAADVIQRAYHHSNERFMTQMRPICAEVTGKPADSASLEECIPKLFQKIYGGGTSKATFTAVGEIRAGKRAESDATAPEQKMLLVFSGGMAPFEAELAKAFGADEAHRIAYSDELCFQAQSL